jgi:hypothetical protein
LLERLPSELNSASIKLLSRGWVAMVEAATLEWIEHREMSRKELLALLSQTLLAILGAHANGPKTKRRARR